MPEQLLYKIGLTLIPGVGDIVGKKLVAYCGGPEAVFREKKIHLDKIPGIGAQTISSIVNQKVLLRAEEEMAFIQKKEIVPLFYLDKSYPKRLQHCADGPILLYYKGNVDLNHQRVIGIVGTRNATEYGKHICDQLVEELASDQVMVVSGLAYGIDTCAHRAAVKYNLPTIGVMAHGLDRVYPAANKGLADRMLNNGGLLTEFMHMTNPDRENFPRRNRIVAGMIDALVVIESAKRGGALITADIANSYSRDVFAIPGRVGDMYSEGCNYLIRTNKAALLEHAVNIRYLMGWDQLKNNISGQTKLFREFSANEQQLLDAFGDDKECGIDDIMLRSSFPASKLAGILLTLEFDGVLVALPGKKYKRV
ncbi:MAG: DNA-protecting protein DprA [Bacteroidetes bacterium HGW-Bacteroidetes-1]|jgi:DNA processing protein|nr:MAG: DNA-protecting protein DprA [Bacteroidetes bacterium HGW-Bacteroidetes-1]